MKSKLSTFFRSFSIGLRDGVLILIALATISPFVYREVLGRTSTNSEVVLGSVNSNNADLPDRPPTPTPTSTPTVSDSTPTPVPTPTAKPTEDPTDDSNDSSGPTVKGGFIHLNIEGIRPGLWTQVQWLAGDGNWYDVNGWGGNLTADNDVLWFVGNEHLGAQAAFRWLAYDAEGGTLLGTSEQFYLPTAVKETIYITITIPAN